MEDRVRYMDQYPEKPPGWVTNAHLTDVDNILQRASEGGKKYVVGPPIRTITHSVQELKDNKFFGIYEE